MACVGVPVATRHATAVTDEPANTTFRISLSPTDQTGGVTGRDRSTSVVSNQAPNIAGTGHGQCRIAVLDLPSRLVRRVVTSNQTAHGISSALHIRTSRLSAQRKTAADKSTVTAGDSTNVVTARDPGIDQAQVHHLTTIAHSSEQSDIVRASHFKLTDRVALSVERTSKPGVAADRHKTATRAPGRCARSVNVVGQHIGLAQHARTANALQAVDVCQTVRRARITVATQGAGESAPSNPEICDIECRQGFADLPPGTRVQREFAR